MNKIERQILENQRSIMIAWCSTYHGSRAFLDEDILKTNRLLKAKNLNSCCDLDAIDKSKGKNEPKYNLRVHGLKRKYAIPKSGGKSE